MCGTVQHKIINDVYLKNHDKDWFHLYSFSVNCQVICRGQPGYVKVMSYWDTDQSDGCYFAAKMCALPTHQAQGMGQ